MENEKSGRDRLDFSSLKKLNIRAALGGATLIPLLLVILFLLAGLAHMLIGLRSVFLDYVHSRARLLAAGLLVRAATAVLMGASVLAVLKLFLGR